MNKTEHLRFSQVKQLVFPRCEGGQMGIEIRVEAFKILIVCLGMESVYLFNKIQNVRDFLKMLFRYEYPI